MPSVRALLPALGLAILLQLGTLTSPVQAATSDPKIVAYVPNWIDLEPFSKTIDYSKLTHINIAFENPTDESGELSYNEENDELIAEAHARKVQVLISIGGGSASSDEDTRELYEKLLSDGKRTAFVNKLSNFVLQHGFDGLDVDLEGPAIGKNYGAFIQDLAKALRPQGKLLTAALSQGYGGNQVPNSVFELFDWVNIMAYDGAGPWNPNAPGPHSSLQFAKDNVDYWLKRGLAKKKAVLGVPFYGYGFGESFRNSDYPYSAILGTYPGASQSDQVGNTIWYNGVPTMKAKAEYARKMGLAGMMIWSLDADVKGDESLLTALYNGLKR